MMIALLWQLATHGAEAGQSIGENMTAGREVVFGPVRDRF